METAVLSQVNLDFAASTPLRSSARAAMERYDESPWAGANPNALHTLGRRAAHELECARRAIASSLGSRCRPSEVVFTSGGTEANHLALLGIAEAVRARDAKRCTVVTSSIEHDSILDNIQLLRERGFNIRIAPVTREGVVDPAELAQLVDESCALVSIMFANNETGVVQPVADLAAIAHRAGARFHTDAIQGYLHHLLDAYALDLDALSIAAHKVGGPVGIGALWLRARTPLTAQVRGGGQESGRRAGTQDVRSAQAFAAVAAELHARLADDEHRVRALADEAYRILLEHPRIHATMGDPHAVSRLPGILSVYVDGADSDDLILQLDAAGFEVSAGSACTAGAAGTSHVLRAMGLSDRHASGALRISFDDRVASADLYRFCQTLRSIAG